MMEYRCMGMRGMTKFSSWIRHTGWMLVMVLVTSIGQCDDRDSQETGWQFQFDLFQMLLEEKKLTLLRHLDAALVQPRDSIVVYIGNPQSLRTSAWIEIESFVKSGGALCLFNETLATVPGVGKFMYGPVTTSRPADQYEGFVDCIRLRSIQDAQGDFEGVRELVTNRSSWFLPFSNPYVEWESIASLPRNCLPAQSQRMAVLSVGRRTDSSGLLITSADTSIFANGMLWHGDNAMAAIRISELLTRDRSRIVFMVEGRVLDSYRTRIPKEQPDTNLDAELPPLPEPELQKMLRLANAVAREVAQSNVLNEALRQQPRGIRPYRYFLFLLGLATVLLLFWLIRLLIANRAWNALPFPMRRMRSAFDMKTMLHSDYGDYRNAAAYLAREFCLEVTGSRATQDWQLFSVQGPGDRSLLKSSADRKLFDKIVDGASRGFQSPMSAKELSQFGTELQRLREKLLAAIPKSKSTS